MNRKIFNQVLSWVLLIAFGMSFIFFAGYFQESQDVLKDSKLEKMKIYIGNKRLTAYVARSKVTRQKGLSGMEGLADNEGMLFIFDTPSMYSFWMKDMKFPIDILWIDQLGRVVFIKSNTLPSSYPESFTSSLPAKYVLETKAGFSDENSLKIGSQISF